MFLWQPLMLNTLGVRSAIGSRRKLSFRNVSNVVMQLLHTIKFSEPVPFSNIATGSFPSAASALGGGVQLGGGGGGGVARGSTCEANAGSVQVSEKGSRKVSGVQPKISSTLSKSRLGSFKVGVASWKLQCCKVACSCSSVLFYSFVVAPVLCMSGWFTMDVGLIGFRLTSYFVAMVLSSGLVCFSFSVLYP